MVAMSIAPVAILALLVSTLSLAWAVASWRNSGPRIELETFGAAFHPKNELPDGAEDTSFQVVHVTNAGRSPADIVSWGVRFFACRKGRHSPRTKIVDYTGELPAPPHLPVRVEQSSETHIHAFPLHRFIEFADAVGKGPKHFCFQFYVHVAGHGEVSTKLVDAAWYLRRWDGRGNSPPFPLTFRMQVLWARLQVLLRRTRIRQPIPNTESTE